LTQGEVSCANMKITGASSLASCAFCGSAKPLPPIIANFVKNEDLSPLFSLAIR